MDNLIFEWDPHKEISNEKKHGISFFHAIRAFEDPRGISLIDTKHSHLEERRYWIGMLDDGRVIIIWYTLRVEIRRIIGAAELRNFRKIYYENTKDKKFEN